MFNFQIAQQLQIHSPYFTRLLNYYGLKLQLDLMKQSELMILHQLKDSLRYFLYLDSRTRV